MATELVSTTEDVIQNVLTLHNYEASGEEDLKFLRGRIKNGKLFVVIKKDDRYFFAPSKFAGYKKNNRRKHLDDLDNRDGRETNQIIKKLLGSPIDFGAPRYKKIDSEFLLYCREMHIEPSKHHRARRYWLLNDHSEEGNRRSDDEAFLPEEIPTSKKFSEGLGQSITVNRWERNIEARKACISHFGIVCNVCGFDFEETYGAIGMGYIHVHHIVPLSKIGKRYQVDPIKDLRPVCPNCHAMLHRGENLMSIAELKARLSRRHPQR